MKYMQNRLLILLLILAGISCTQKNSTKAPETTAFQKEKDPVLIKINGGGTNSDTCVQISHDLEKDAHYNKLLGSYICHYLWGTDTAFAEKELKEIIDRPSFSKMILLFYNDKESDKISFAEKERLADFRNELLYGIKDCCIDKLYAISDTLLSKNIFAGVEVLWDKTDVHKLPSFNDYLKRIDTGNFFVYADLAAVLHNSGNDSLSNRYLSKAATLTNFNEEYDALKSLMQNKKRFDVAEYKEAVYGGM